VNLTPEQQSFIIYTVALGIFGVAFHMMKGVADEVKKAVGVVTLLVPRVEGLERDLGKLEGKLEALQAQREKEARERAEREKEEAAKIAVLAAQVATNTEAIKGYHAKNNELQGQLRDFFRGAKP
jgi:seryl-tRNA synthetase